jgi:hypothetical protein
VTISAPARRDVTLAARQNTVAVPTYASACSGTSRYSSACSCWGFTVSTTTVATPTVTVTSTVTASASAPPDPPFNTADYGCDTNGLISGNFGYPSCRCNWNQTCGAAATSNGNAQIINPPNANPLVGNYQYCYLECDRRRACYGFSYTFLTSMCTLFENSDGSHGSFISTPDPYSVSGELYDGVLHPGYECGGSCPLEA